MFFSRFHCDKDSVHLSFDSLTGELLEFYVRPGCDNLIKSTPWGMPSVFALVFPDGVATVPSPSRVRADPSLSPEKDFDGSRLRMVWNSVMLGDRKLDVRVTVTVVPDGTSAVWSAVAENNSGIPLVEFRFPVIGGMWLGDTPHDDTLVYPYNAGVKIPDPCASLAHKPERIYWRWQDYRYVYTVGGVCGYKNTEGVYSYGSSYSGPLSMPWCDLYDRSGGLYFGMHSENGICFLRAETADGSDPGLYLHFARQVQKTGSVSIENVVTAFHGGDWHDGADIYRAFRGVQNKNPLPEWWKESAALAAHYDFRYQSGGVVHTYSDMGAIAEQAELIGCDHILCSGWHIGGFDNGFPEYRADPELGGEEGLRRGIADIHSRGKKVSFYINSRIANLRFDNEKDFINENAVVRTDGSIETELYGDESLRFATMCAGSRNWQDRLVGAAEYVASLGADGVYLDQLAMAAPRVCHSDGHGHADSDTWCDGYRSVIERVRDITAESGEKLTVITEGISDKYGDTACGGLVSTFAYHHNGAFPELYRYTFPNHRMVDMVYPEKNLAMRPVHVAQASREMIDRAFVCGMYFWVYDLEQDNTFRRDEESRRYLCEAIAARREWMKRYPDYVFADERGIEVYKATAKHYEGDGEGIIAFAHGGDGCVILSFPAECPLKTTRKGSRTVIQLPDVRFGTVPYKKVPVKG